MDSNRRDFTRVSARLVVEIASGAGTLSGKVENLSLNGVALTCSHSLTLGTRCRVSLVLAGADPAVRIEVAGTVQRVAPGSLGIAFDEIDEESYVHLRSLILLNADNADHVEDEFESSVGLKRRAGDF